MVIIPRDELTPDLQARAVRIDTDGDTVTVYEPGDPLPQPQPIHDTPYLAPLSAWQFRTLLNTLGIRQQVEAFVASADREIADNLDI